MVGLPGDTVSYRDNVVSVNGVPYDYTLLGRYVGEGQGREMAGASLTLVKLDDEIEALLEAPASIVNRIF